MLVGPRGKIRLQLEVLSEKVVICRHLGRQLTYYRFVVFCNAVIFLNHLENPWRLACPASL